jgi:ribose transport system substrate-binding protein
MKFTHKVAAGLLLSSALMAGQAMAEGKTFGLIVNNMAFPYNVVLADGFTKAVEAGGDKAVVLDSKMSMETQANQIDDLMAQGVDGIAFMANDSVAVMALVDKVAEAGLPIVAAAVPVGDPNVNPVDYAYPNLNALVSTQDVMPVTSQGVYAASILPKDREVKIAVVEGAPGFAVVTQRQEGFEAALTEAGIKFAIVSSQPSDWTPDSGEQICANALTANPDLDLIFSHADDMALGCAKAIADAGSKAPGRYRWRVRPWCGRDPERRDCGLGLHSAGSDRGAWPAKSCKRQRLIRLRQRRASTSPMTWLP